MTLRKLNKFDAFLALLAVDRITRLVTEDEITRPIREAVQRKWPDSKMAYAVSCHACVSVWAGLLVSSGLIPRRVVSALAASGAVLIMDRQDERVGDVVSAYRRRASGAVQG